LQQDKAAAAGTIVGKKKPNVLHVGQLATGVFCEKNAAAGAGFILQIDTASSDEEPKAQTRCLHDCTQAPLALKLLPVCTGAGTWFA